MRKAIGIALDEDVNRTTIKISVLCRGNEAEDYSPKCKEEYLVWDGDLHEWYRFGRDDTLEELTQKGWTTKHQPDEYLPDYELVCPHCSAFKGGE
jgi:hypothetical protein